VLYFVSGFPIHFAVTKFVGLVFLLIEADSIDENYYKIKGVRLKDLFRNKIGVIKGALISLGKLKK
jgi:hypothetical protein